MREQSSEGRDYPFYNGLPAALSGWQWLLLMASVALGFLLLITLLDRMGSGLSQVIPGLLYLGIPLLTLALFAGHHWKALFGPFRLSHIFWAVAFFVLNLVVASAVGFLIMQFFKTTANPAINSMAQLDGFGIAMFYAKTAPQLVGEEVMTILPFLALLHLGTTRFGLSRNKAVIMSLLVTSLAFGAAHLPTYDWNIAQSVFGIGAARVVLTLAYIKTKSIWASAGAHILNDFSTFTLQLLAASTVSGAV